MPTLPQRRTTTGDPLQGEGGLLRRLGGGLAHHVNNALTGVVGHLELALRHVPPGSPGHAHLQGALACAYQAAAKVRRIVAFACRPGGPDLLVPLSLADAARTAVRAEGPRSPAVRCEAVVEDEAVVSASPALLELALQALVANAVEAQPEGGSVTLLVRRAGDDCLLCVRDRGPGLSPLARAHLFEPFWTSKSGHHLGLGLVTARELIQAQGGTLEVEPAPGQGCVVTLTFPALRAERHDEPAALPAPHLGAVPGPVASLV